MSASAVHRCTCPTCRVPEPHPDRVLHQQINLPVSRLDERQRRWFVAFEAKRLVGHGGAQRLAEIAGVSRHAIRRVAAASSRRVSPTAPPSACAPPAVGGPDA